MTHHYQEIKVTTKFVNSNGNEVVASETGTTPSSKKDIPGYVFKETTTDTDGNVTHHYAKEYITKFVDQNGKDIIALKIDTTPSEKENIPGYVFVETTTDADGNVTHHYAKEYTTKFLDKERIYNKICR